MYLHFMFRCIRLSNHSNMFNDITLQTRRKRFVVTQYADIQKLIELTFCPNRSRFVTTFAAMRKVHNIVFCTHFCGIFKKILMYATYINLLIKSILEFFLVKYTSI